MIALIEEACAAGTRLSKYSEVSEKQPGLVRYIGTGFFTLFIDKSRDNE